MTYSATFVNRLAQFGVAQYDLIVTDDQGVMPDHRIPVDLPLDSDTEEGRAALANKYIPILTDRANSQAVKTLLDNEWAKRQATTEAERTNLANMLLAADRRTWEEVTKPLVLDPEAVLWAEADAFAEAQFDANSRVGLLWLAIDPNCPQWRMARVLDVQAWWLKLWTQYAMDKAQVLAGNPTHFNTEAVGPCPWTIWQIQVEGA